MKMGIMEMMKIDKGGLRRELGSAQDGRFTGLEKRSGQLAISAPPVATV